MNIGAEALIPSRLSCNTCPISCTQIKATNPTANHTGYKSAHAPTLKSIVSAVPTNFTLSRATRSHLNFASSSPTATSGASRRFTTLHSPPPGLIGSYLGGSGRSSRSLRKMGSRASSSPR
jgi:hypothetical protein